MTTATASVTDWYFQGPGESLVQSAITALGSPPPPLMAILAEPHTISVLPRLDEAFPAPPAPWEHIPDIDSWACDTARLRPRRAPHRWPVLLPIGAARGGILLVSLESVCPLTIGGPAEAVDAVLRAWVLNLLLTPGRTVASTARAITALDRVGSPRLITAPDTATLLQQIQDRGGASPDVVILDDHDPSAVAAFVSTPCVIVTGDGTHQGWWSFHVTDVQQGTLANEARNLALELDTITSIDDAGWQRIVGVLGDDVVARQRRAAPPAQPVTAPPQPAPEAAAPPAWELPPQPGPTPPLDGPPVWRAVPAPSAVAEPSPPPAPAPSAPEQLPATLAPATTTTDPAGDPPHIWVRILGEPALTPPEDRGVEEVGRTRSWTAVLAYLATVGRDGATREEVSECWPANLDPPGEETVRQTLSRIRTFLGADNDGNKLLTDFVRGGRRSDSEPPQKVHLSPIVLSDWERWQQLVGDHPQAATDSALSEALALVRGPAFDVPRNLAPRYDKWSKFLKDEVTDAIPAGALEMVRRLDSRGDRAGVLAAAEAGLKANPQRQDLWRPRLAAAPDQIELARLANELRKTIPSAEIEAATRKLLP